MTAAPAPGALADEVERASASDWVDTAFWGAKLWDNRELILAALRSLPTFEEGRRVGLEEAVRVVQAWAGAWESRQDAERDLTKAIRALAAKSGQPGESAPSPGPAVDETGLREQLRSLVYGSLDDDDTVDRLVGLFAKLKAERDDLDAAGQRVVARQIAEMRRANAAEALAAKLKAERDLCRDKFTNVELQRDAMFIRAEAAEALAAEYREALEPFAALEPVIAAVSDQPEANWVMHFRGSEQPTFYMFRRAAAFLAKAPSPNASETGRGS